MEKDYDILIVGGGLVGQAAALALSRLRGLSIALIDNRNIFSEDIFMKDGRASALSQSSLNVLQNLKLDLSPNLQIIQDMLITEGAIGEDTHWRLHFENEGEGTHSSQMIENIHLAKALKENLKKIDNLTIFAPARAEHLEHTVSGVRAVMGNTKISARLLVAADGRNSHIRTRAGIVTDGREYTQHALVTTIRHTLAHDGLALQRFLPGGPLAALPLPNQRSQIVWSDKASAVAAALSVTDKEFEAELALRLGDHLGNIVLDAPRQSYPLRLQLSQNYVGERLVLIGDAAHVIHPLAGQGLNLGLRDVAVLYDVLSEAISTGQDIGGAILGVYESWRKSDVMGLASITDGLSLIYSSPRGWLSRPASKLLGHARRLGLAIVDDAEFLKRLIMNEAEGLTGQVPSLLRL